MPAAVAAAPVIKSRYTTVLVRLVEDGK